MSSEVVQNTANFQWLDYWSAFTTPHHVCTGNQMVTSEIRNLFLSSLIKILTNFQKKKKFDETQVKSFLNFTSIPLDYLLISWVANDAYNHVWFLTCLLY